MYLPHETELSQAELKSILTHISKPACVIGGWAVYLTVGKNFSAEHGREYLGSRDIDLGFHIEKAWTSDELKASDLALAIRNLTDMGFEPISFRYVKHFHTETRKQLIGQAARETALYEMFDLYVDPVVDYLHPQTRDALGFVPIDEPLLEWVFVQQESRKLDLYDRRVVLPSAHVLLATKLRSVLKRDKEHKRIKDIADIVALSWYSDEKLSALKNNLAIVVPEQETRSVVEAFTPEDLEKTSGALGMAKGQVQSILNELRS